MGWPGRIVGIAAWAIAAATAGAATAGAATAGAGASANAGGEHPFTAGDARGTIVDPWPGRVGRGYFPIFVRVENTAKESRTLEIDAVRTGGGVSYSVRKSVKLGAGERTTAELLLPAFFDSSETLASVSGAPVVVGGVAAGKGRTGPRPYELFLSCAGADDRVSGIGSSDPWASLARAVVIATASPLSPGDDKRWAAALSTKSLGGFGARRGTDNVAVGALTFAELPSRPEAYSSLHAVVVDATAGLPPAEKWGPLLAWTRLGGTLVLVGKNAPELAMASEGLREWMEARFVLRIGGVDPAARVVGLGSAVLCEGDFDPDDASTQSRIQSALEPDNSWVPTPERPHLREFDLNLDAFRELPRAPFVLVLALFVLLVGPVNFILAKRRGKPTIVLFTIPILSAVTFVSFLAIAFSYQGLDVRTATYSLTVLDQRSHQSSTVSHRSVFAGFLTGRGFAPGPGTSIYHVTPTPAHGVLRSSPAPAADEATGFRADLTDGVLLSGDYLPSRRTFRQLVLTDQPRRLRLSIERRGSQLSVENGLGVPIRRLLVQDGRGGVYQMPQSSAPLAAGGTAILSFTTNPDVDRETKIALRSGKRLDATYSALLDASPFSDNCGVSSTEVFGHHALVGILDASEAKWK